MTWFLAAFVGIAFLASILGVDFKFSFWGSIERSEGLLLWLHLLPFFIVLTSVLKKREYWLIAFDYSIVITLIMSFFCCRSSISDRRIL